MRYGGFAPWVLLFLFCLTAPVFGYSISDGSTIACGNCGAESPILFSRSHSFPFPYDMDFRPLALRYDLDDLQRCEACGYLGWSGFTRPLTPAVRAVFEGPEFAALKNDEALPEDASLLLRAGLLGEAAGLWYEAGNAALSAAWLCDPGYERAEIGVRNWAYGRENSYKRERWHRDMADWEEDRRNHTGKHGREGRAVPEEPPVFVPEPLPEVTPELSVRAQELRALALRRLLKAWEERDLPEEVPSELPYLIAELYRRSGDFSKAWFHLRAAKEMEAKGREESGDDELWRKRLFDLQEKFIHGEDDARRTVEAIMPEDL